MSLDITLSTCACALCNRADVLFAANITHNLKKMAEEARIYGVLWRPEENGIKSAGQLIAPLFAAIENMEDNPLRFKALNPPNGWGHYEMFVEWLKNLLDQCRKHPNAAYSASR